MADNAASDFIKRPYAPFVYVLALAPVLFFFYTLYKAGVDIPFYDDYDAVLGFVLDFRDSSSVADGLGLLFAQHNEHRIAFVRVVALLWFYASGGVNFSALSFIGYLGFAAFTAALFFAFRRGGFKVLWFLPVPFVLFHPRYFEMVPFYSMAALSNLFVHLFALAALLLAARKGTAAFIAALCLAVVAVYTQGGGLFVLPAGLLLLALSRAGRGRLYAWAAVGLVTGLTYFIGYRSPADHPPVMATLLGDPIGVAMYFFSFLGAGFFFPAAHGVLTLVFFACLTWKRHWRTNPVLYSFIVFLMLVAVAASLARAGFGVEQSLSSRYTVVSLILFAAMYAAAAERLEGRPLKALLAAIFIFSIFFNAYSYATNSANVMQLRSSVSTRMARWVFDRGYTDGVINPDYRRASSYLDRAAASGVYSPDLAPVTARTAEVKLDEATGTARAELDGVYRDAALGHLIEGWAFEEGVDARQRVYLVLRSEARSYVLTAAQVRRPDIARKAGKGYDSIGFMAYVPYGTVVPGDYSVGLYVRSDASRGAVASGLATLHVDR